MALNLIVIALWAERSRSLMAAVGSALPIRTLVPVTSFANTINNLTPASSGEVLRAMVLRRRHGVPYENSTAVILAERLWAIGLMLVTASAAAIGTLIAAPVPIVATAWVGASALAFTPSIMYAVGLRPGWLLGRMLGRFGSTRIRRLREGLAAMDARLKEITLDPRRSGHFVATTVLIFAAFATQLWLVLEALGVSISPLGAWAAYGISICAGVVSALPFGLGAADVVLVVLLVAQGVDTAAAGAAAILLRAVTTLPLGIAGALSWMVLGAGSAGPANAERGDREPTG
jgi:uncharacterized protein (TIRG00374 family)